MSSTYQAAYAEDMPSQSPGFGFPLVAKALVPVLVQKAKGATVLGIHGPWGAGKTTLMGSLRRELEAGPFKYRAVFIDFNAWKFQDRQALWRALILHMLGELRTRTEADVKSKAGDAKAQAELARRRRKLEELEQALYRAFAVEEKGPWTVNWRSLIVELVGILLSAVKLDFVGKALRESTSWFGRLFFGSKEKEGEDPLINKSRVDELAKVFERTTIERHVAQVQSVEQFLKEFRGLADEFTTDGRRVFVFIDDLDRCLPESALEIFEAIKLFLDAPGCVYVVALDRDVIRKALDVRYSRGGEAALGQRFISADQYIEKTISLSFDLPRLSDTDALSIIDGATLPFALSDETKRLILDGLGTNPRRIKRFMNTLALHLNLARITHEAAHPVDANLLNGADTKVFNVFVKLLLLSYRYSGLFSLALEDEELLQRLQQTSNLYNNKVQANDAEGARAERVRLLGAELSSVAALQHDAEFWRLMSRHPSFTAYKNDVDRLRNWFRAAAKTPAN